MATDQLTRADLKNMTPAEIVKAQKDGKLDKLLGKTAKTSPGEHA